MMKMMNVLRPTPEPRPPTAKQIAELLNYLVRTRLIQSDHAERVALQKHIECAAMAVFDHSTLTGPPDAMNARRAGRKVLIFVWAE